MMEYQYPCKEEEGGEWNMKKATINVGFDEEKTAAARLYLKQKNLKLEDELAKAMESIYTKNVPTGVRDFIDMKTGMLVEVSTQKNTGRKEE